MVQQLVERHVVDELLVCRVLGTLCSVPGSTPTHWHDAQYREYIGAQGYTSTQMAYSWHARELTSKYVYVLI